MRVVQSWCVCAALVLTLAGCGASPDKRLLGKWTPVPDIPLLVGSGGGLSAADAIILNLRNKEQFLDNTPEYDFQPEGKFALSYNGRSPRVHGEWQVKKQAEETITISLRVKDQENEIAVSLITEDSCSIKGQREYKAIKYVRAIPKPNLEIKFRPKNE